MAIYQLDDEHPELPADHRYWVAEPASVIGRVRLKTDAQSLKRASAPSIRR